MADPLIQAQESLAPAPATTRFFDPAAGASVLARYAGVNQEAEAARNLGEATNQLNRSRFDRAQQRHALQTWDREDEAYVDRQKYKVARGGFLTNLTDKSVIDPEADDYLEKRAAFYKNLPMEAKDDDAVAAIIASFDHRFNARQAETERDINRQEVVGAQDRAFARKQGVTAATKGMSKEEIDAFRDPISGELDTEALMFKAGERARELKDTEASKKVDRSKSLIAYRNAFSTAKAEDKAAQTRVEDTIETALSDLRPSKLLLQQAQQTANEKRKSTKAITKDDFERYTTLQDREDADYADRFFTVNMLRKAGESATLADFIKAFPNVKPEQRAALKAVWDHAKQSPLGRAISTIAPDEPADAQMETGPGAAAPAAPVAPAAAPASSASVAPVVPAAAPGAAAGPTPTDEGALARFLKAQEQAKALNK